jgi:hypothetical protein
MRWDNYEEETIKAFTYKTDREIAAYLADKGYDRTPKQVSNKRLRMGLKKSGARPNTDHDVVDLG